MLRRKFALTPVHQAAVLRYLVQPYSGKATFEISRPAAGTAAEASAKALGTGRVLGLREKKAEIAQAEKGKEIGALLNSQIAVQIGDTVNGVRAEGAER